MKNDQFRMQSKNFWDTVFHSDYDYRELVAKDWSVFIRNLRDEKVKNVLDFGCGGGHWSMVLAKANFCVSAYDISEVALSKLQKWAYEEGISIKIVHQLKQIKEFDCIVCNSVIDHLIPVDARKTMHAFKTILKKNGIIYLSFDKEESEDKNNYVLAEEGMRIYKVGDFKGMIWKYYSENEIRGLCKEFTIENFYTTKSGRRQVWLRYR